MELMHVALFNYLHLDGLLESMMHYLQMHDIFTNLGRMFRRILRGLKTIAVPGGFIGVAIGGLYYIFGGEQGKHTAKVWWLSTLIGVAIVMGADAIVNWVSHNAKF